jgi:hypothetical protein
LLATRAPKRLYSKYDITVRAREPWAMLEPASGGERATFDHGRVRHETTDGDLIASRDDPRARFFGFSGLRRNMRWDVLDLTYFAGYAMWSYLTTPLLLTRNEVEVSEGPPIESRGGRWRRLDARFGEGIDTHSEAQSFWFDTEGLLRRHDYTAKVVGGWARAAHTCDAHREFDGLVFPTRRRVHPRRQGGPLGFPTLVWIELDTIEVETE